MKKSALLIAIIGSIALFFAMCQGAGKKKDPKNKEVIIIDQVKKRARAVKFKHWKHQDEFKAEVPPRDITCADCHHTRDGRVEYKSCYSCHKKEEYTNDDEQLVISLTAAYHNRCKNCHRRSPSAARVGCSACHSVRE